MVCSFCQINDTESFFKSYCKPCADLRRQLILYDPQTCSDILNRCLLRSPEQITYKIQAELKRNAVSELKKKCEDKEKNHTDDNKDYDSPK